MSVARLNITSLSPKSVAWSIWAGAVVIDLSESYNLPNPGDEGSWKAWATELLNISGVNELGLPDPRLFGDDWRSWATAFTLTVV